MLHLVIAIHPAFGPPDTPMPEPRLVWTPTWDYVAEQITARGHLKLLIAPFAQLSPMQRLVELVGDTSDLQIVVRWNGPDILGGVSDLNVYPYLRDSGIPLYIHPRIHLKLLVFDRSIAFHTSGNITARGLGLVDQANVEIGCQVSLTAKDWGHIYRVLDDSHRVDDTMHQEALEYIHNHQQKAQSPPALELKPAVDKDFSILSLPASDSPASLYSFYCAPGEPGDDLEVCTHDLALYRVPDGLGEEGFFSHVQDAFRKQRFVQRVVDLIRTHKSARFGLVTEWIQENCSDKPTPYRWEIKSNTRRLYNWLEYFLEEISWDIPGRHSQVIYWRER